MTCFSPLSAWQTDDGEIVFVERGSIRRALSLACGQCYGCRLARSRDWATRVLHEAKLHADNCFITLTFSDKHCPDSLDYRLFQLFMKRLRKRFGKVRFYMCGEYGEKFSRPHFHACLFGFDFPDRVYFRRLPSGSKIFTSAILESLWTYGFSSVGEVTFESAAYVARYVMKKVYGEASVNHYCVVDGDTGECFDRCPEFTRMSLKPGIGRGWIERYERDVYPHDYVVVNGMKFKPPKYYDKYLEVVNPDEWEHVRMVREKAFCGHDSSPDRLRTREVVARARGCFKLRSLE